MHFHSFALNIAVLLLVGSALLWVWRRDREQAFLQSLGWACISQVARPISYALWASDVPILHALGAVSFALVGTVYLILLLVGCSRLAGRPMTRPQWLLLMLLGTAISAVSQSIGPAETELVSAVLKVAVGIVAAAWLWRLGTAERISGLLLVALGVNQFTYPIFGEAALTSQASVASMLRVALGLALLQAAVHRSSDESRRVRERLMRLTEHSLDGIAVVAGTRILYANPSLTRIFGGTLPTDAMVLWAGLKAPAHERDAALDRHRRIVSGQLASADWTSVRDRGDGERIHLRLSAWRTEWDGQAAEQIVVRDETAQNAAVQALLHQATHDQVTGLPNRSALRQKLQELVSMQPVPEHALLLLDIDRFKLFNDAHGHAMGDQVLQAFAAALSREFASQVQVLHVGEDEFALLAPGAGRETAMRLATRLKALLARPVAVGAQRLYIDVSIGIALHSPQAPDAESLLRAANAAMHEAKRTPGTSIQFTDERFERGSGALLQIEQSMRMAIAAEEFALVYQPKVSARDGALLGFEALVRWERPGLGRVGPLDFIPAAERLGLIVPLGNLILDLACAQIALWRSEGLQVVPVAVNVSPLQLLDPGFPQQVMQALQRHGVPPALLTLEITESAAITHLDEACGQLHSLRAQGIDVALDDFGTGYSSLNLLRALPLRTVKIDRSLIDPMPAADAISVVRTICTLAKGLRLEVVAEGVEGLEHQRAAIAAGCDVLQGYLYARPLMPAEAAGWLLERHAAAFEAGISQRDGRHLPMAAFVADL